MMSVGVLMIGCDMYGLGNTSLGEARSRDSTTTGFSVIATLFDLGDKTPPPKPE